MVNSWDIRQIKLILILYEINHWRNFSWKHINQSDLNTISNATEFENFMYKTNSPRYISTYSYIMVRICTNIILMNSQILIMKIKKSIDTNNSSN